MHLHYEKYGIGILKGLKAHTSLRKGGLCVDKNELYKVAGSKLRDMRKATGLSVFKVGRAIGVSGNYISQIERGDRPASDAVLIGLAELYSVDKKGLFDLYSRMESEEANSFMAHPELRKTFVEITSNKELSKEEMDEINKEFQAIAKKYFNKEGK